jgi:hypothetical protein
MLGWPLDPFRPLLGWVSPSTGLARDSLRIQGLPSLAQPMNRETLKMSPNDFYAGASVAFVVILLTKFLAIARVDPSSGARTAKTSPGGSAIGSV